MNLSAVLVNIFASGLDIKLVDGKLQLLTPSIPAHLVVSLARNTKPLADFVASPAGKEARDKVDAARAEFRQQLRVLLCPDVHFVPDPEHDMRFESCCERFIRDRCMPIPGAVCPSSELYGEFQRWATERGESAESRRRLGVHLRRAGFHPAKAAHGRRMWKGVALVQRHADLALP